MILVGIGAEFFGRWGHQLDWRLFLKVSVVSTFISGAVASLFLYPIQDAGHVAAWAQALGSIIAIASGFVVIKMQLDGQKKIQEEEWRRQYERDELMAKVLYRTPLYGKLLVHIGTLKWFIKDFSNQPVKLLFSKDARKKIAETVWKINSDLSFSSTPYIAVVFSQAAFEISNALAALFNIENAMNIDGDVKGDEEAKALFENIQGHLQIALECLEIASNSLGFQREPYESGE